MSAEPSAYQELRLALLRELAEAFAAQAAARSRAEQILADLDQAQRDHAEDAGIAAHARLAAHWERRTGGRQ